MITNFAKFLLESWNSDINKNKDILTFRNVILRFVKTETDLINLFINLLTYINCDYKIFTSYYSKLDNDFIYNREVGNNLLISVLSVYSGIIEYMFLIQTFINISNDLNYQNFYHSLLDMKEHTFVSDDNKY
jgi:hypothetical protein